jgi:hypothetical protein
MGHGHGGAETDRRGAGAAVGGAGRDGVHA